MLCLALRQEEIASTRRPASELSSAAENRKPGFSGKWGDSNNFLVLAPDPVRAHSGVYCVDPLSHRSFVCCRFQSLHCARVVGTRYRHLLSLPRSHCSRHCWAAESLLSHGRTVLKSRGSALPLCRLLSTSVAIARTKDWGTHSCPHCRLRHSTHTRLSPLSQRRTLSQCTLHNKNLT